MELLFNNTYLSLITTSIEDGLDNDAIIARIKETIIGDFDEHAMLIQIKRIRNKKRTKTGSKLILLGVLILGVGFLSSVLLHHFNKDITFPLYGLTALGTICVSIGLVMIFS